MKLFKAIMILENKMESQKEREGQFYWKGIWHKS